MRKGANLHWGLVRAKHGTVGWKLINARMETVLEKPSFRATFALLANEAYDKMKAA